MVPDQQIRVRGINVGLDRNVGTSGYKVDEPEVNVEMLSQCLETQGYSSYGMREALLRLVFVWGCTRAANELETNVGDFFYGDQKVHLYFVRGDLAPSNWSFFELKWEGRLRIILDSLNGDADLYLSYTKKRPGVGVHEHDMLSMTCGLDVLDVPQSSKRPVHLGVYGHPSKSETSYKMLFVMMEKQDSEFEEDVNIPPELIHSFETEEDHGDYPQSLRETMFTILRFIFEVLIEILL